MELETCRSAPQDWRRVSIASLCSRFTSGGTPSRAHPEFYQNGSIPWVKTKELTDTTLFDTEEKITADALNRSSAKVLPAGTILMAMYGATVGQLGRLGVPMACNQACAAMVVDEDISDSNFLFYSLLTHRPQIKGLSTGAAQQNLSGNQIKNFILPFPRLAEQRLIGGLFRAVDDKIELNRRMNETLVAIATAIFRDWFVNFGPTRAKMMGAPPYLGADLWALFPDRLDEAWRPKGWTLTTLGQLLSVLETGGRPKGGVAAYKCGVPSVGAESIVGLGIFDFNKTKFVPEDYFAAMRRGHVENGDVLLYKDGGRPGQFEPHATLVGDGFPFERFAINEHVYRIRAIPEVGQAMLFFCLTSDALMEEMRIKGTGVAIPGLNSTQVKSLTILLPSPPLVRAFNEIADPLIARVLANCAESRTLAQTRDLLLPKLMSGEIRLKQAERVLEAAE